MLLEISERTGHGHSHLAHGIREEVAEALRLAAEQDARATAMPHTNSSWTIEVPLAGRCFGTRPSA